MDPTNQIKQIIRFKKNKCPLILKYYYEGKSISNTPSFPKNEQETRIILIENEIAQQKYPISPTAEHELHHWYNLIQPKHTKKKEEQTQKKADKKNPNIDITMNQLTRKQTQSFTKNTSYYSNVLNIFNINNETVNQLTDTSQYHRRIGVIPNTLTPILRHMGIRHRHIHQTQSQIHKKTLQGIQQAWSQDQKETHKWHLPYSGIKPKKLTYPLQIQPIKRTRYSKYTKQKPKEQAQPTITDTMGIHKLNKIASYDQFYKTQPQQTNRDTYTNEDELISYKRKRYDQGAIQWTYNNSHIRATKIDYSKYTEDHLKQLYYSITNKQFKSNETKTIYTKRTRNRKDTRRKRKRKPPPKDTIINALLQIDNTFQALLTHHEWINTHLDTNYKIDIPAEPVYLQKLGVSIHNIENEYKYWQQYNRWKPTPKLPKTKKTKSNRTHTNTHKHKAHTWHANQAIDIKGYEFNVNTPFIRAKIIIKIKDKWEVQLQHNPTKYYWSSEKLDEIARPHSDLNAKHFDMGRCQICTEPTKYSYHTLTEAKIEKSHKCTCGLIAHTKCMAWSHKNTNTPLCEYCTPNKTIPTPYKKYKRHRTAYASYTQGSHIYIHNIPPSAHRCSHKPCKLSITSIRSTPPIQIIPLSNNPSSAFTTRYDTTQPTQGEKNKDHASEPIPSTKHRPKEIHQTQKKKTNPPQNHHTHATTASPQNNRPISNPTYTQQNNQFNPKAQKKGNYKISHHTRNHKSHTSTTSRITTPTTNTSTRDKHHQKTHEQPASQQTPHVGHITSIPIPTSHIPPTTTPTQSPLHLQQRKNNPISLNNNLSNWLTHQNRHQVTVPRNGWCGYEAIRIQRQDSTIPQLLDNMTKTLTNSPNILYDIFSPDDESGREHHRQQRIHTLTKMSQSYPSPPREQGSSFIYDIMTISTLYNTEVYMLASNNHLYIFHPPTLTRLYPQYTRHTYPHFPNIPPNAIGIIHRPGQFSAMLPSQLHKGGGTPPSPPRGLLSQTEGRRNGKRKGSTIHSKKTKKQAKLTTFWTDPRQPTEIQSKADE